MRVIYFVCSAAVFACSSLSAQSTLGGRILSPAEGEPLVLCHAPDLSINIKVDSATTGATEFSMGTASLIVGGSNSGVHDVDEITYFTHGRGRGIIGTDTVAVEPGSTMYVPRGVRHGFINTGGSALQFVWVVSPRGLEDRFRVRGVRPGLSCRP